MVYFGTCEIDYDLMIVPRWDLKFQLPGCAESGWPFEGMRC